MGLPAQASDDDDELMIAADSEEAHNHSGESGQDVQRAPELGRAACATAVSHAHELAPAAGQEGNSREDTAHAMTMQRQQQPGSSGRVPQKGIWGGRGMRSRQAEPQAGQSAL